MKTYTFTVSDEEHTQIMVGLNHRKEEAEAKIYAFSKDETRRKLVPYWEEKLDMVNILINRLFKEWTGQMQGK